MQNAEGLLRIINIRTKIDAHIPRIGMNIKILDGTCCKTVIPVSSKKVKDLLTLTVYEEKNNVSDPRQKQNTDSFLQIDITKTKTRAPIYVSCSVHSLNIIDLFLPREITAIHAYEGKQETETWTFPRLIKISRLNKRLILGNTINLYFNINVCDDAFQTYFEDSAPSKPTLTGNLLVTLYKTGLCSDAKLKIGDESFTVHKSILSIRSSVFKKPLRKHANQGAADGNDPKNDQESFLGNLKDVDKDNLKRCWFFLHDVFEFKGFFKLFPFLCECPKMTFLR
ncbi:hypothetical protein TNIN_467621 [Trichonephila inaurata madagascariensis]|uniref:BTB domain-containing protein n=1 Tax=Trichonephila inaurata madagascariensis TaxID=2747483 RepID=A0A8X6WYJ3_9ARAC|nr:hypothetical protein TNIN_467621 [Trichonephila inaurata madagascariensis]